MCFFFYSKICYPDFSYSSEGTVFVQRHCADIYIVHVIYALQNTIYFLVPSMSFINQIIKYVWKWQHCEFNNRLDFYFESPEDIFGHYTAFESVLYPQICSSLDIPPVFWILPDSLILSTEEVIIQTCFANQNTIHLTWIIDFRERGRNKEAEWEINLIKGLSLKQALRCALYLESLLKVTECSSPVYIWNHLR